MLAEPIACTSLPSRGSTNIDHPHSSATGPDFPAEFPGWAELLPSSAGRQHVLLMFDFDGTLSEIVENPEAAALRPGNAEALGKLGSNSGFTVGVISGRSLADIVKRVGLDGLVYAGNHGLEIKAPGFSYIHPSIADASEVIEETAFRLVQGLRELPGIQVENKGVTLTVHYRRTPSEFHEQAQAISREIMRTVVADGRCRITTAKCALELRPAVDWHKGRAFDLIKDRINPHAYPVFLGDDGTDEDAFRTAQDAGGFGVFVGPEGAHTCAQYRLDSPASVSRAIADLADP